ncbi:MAG TPA: porin family protein [Gemmatimonadales bacterium]
MSAYKWRAFWGYGVTLMAVVCPASGTVAAQDRAAVGAEVGYSRADLTGENSQLVKSRQGAITGLYLHVPVNRVMSVRPELLFSLRGGQARVGIADGDDFAEIDVELAYLELPLLARFVLPRGRFRPVVFGGPSVALQIGCDFLFILAPDTSRSTCGERDTTDVIDVSQVREWDFAWVAGGAMELHLPRTTLSLQGRYTGGLRSVLEGGVDLRNRTLAVLFGLTF